MSIGGIILKKLYKVLLFIVYILFISLSFIYIRTTYFGDIKIVLFNNDPNIIKEEVEAYKLSDEELQLIANDKLLKSPVVKVKDYGAKGDGISDDSEAIQKAIDSLKNSGGTIFFEDKIYLCNDIKLYSNIEIVGVGNGTVLLQKHSLSGYKALMSINHGGSGTKTPEGNTELSGSITNVTIRNIKMKGNVVKDGFSEHVALLTLNSCSNIVIDDVYFEAFQGDAIFMGVESIVERHLKNITIRNCTFDGVNKDNRNGISILEGTDISIENCTFENLTRKDMPGAIDIEPNLNESILWTLLENIKIVDCTFENLGTSAILFSNRNDLKLMEKGKPNHIEIRGCTINGDSDSGIVLYQEISSSNRENENMDFLIEMNNISNCVSPLIIKGISGARIENNVFQDCTNALNLGMFEEPVYNVLISKNEFYRVGEISSSGIMIQNGSDIRILNNYFEDCGRISQNSRQAIIAFVNGTSNKVTIQDNNVASTDGISSILIRTEADHIMDESLNTIENNNIDALPKNEGDLQ